MQERFAVRTAHYADDDQGTIKYSTTIAQGRAQAILHAERIGKIDSLDREHVRRFLEGFEMRAGQLVLTSGETRWIGTATIYLIED